MSAAAELLDEWADWQRAGAHSERTIDGRIKIVQLLEKRREVDPVTCGWRPLARFLADPKLSVGTKATYRSALKAWYGWLLRMEYRADDPTVKLPAIKPPRGRPHPMTVSEVQRLLDSGLRTRTRTMILLAAFQGLRVHEIAKLRGEDIHGDVLTVLGKGRVLADLPLHPIIAAEAALYPRTGYWFPTIGDPDTPIMAKSVSNVLCKAIARAGIDSTARSLRHFYGTWSLRAAGGNLRVCQELMRHASPATTAIYTEVSAEDQRAAVLALPKVLNLPMPRQRGSRALGR